MANIRQSLTKNSNEIAKEPFKSADFEETGEFGENSQKTLEKVNNNKKNDQGSSSRVAILTKTKIFNGEDAPKFSQKLK